MSYELFTAQTDEDKSKMYNTQFTTAECLTSADNIFL